MYENTEILGVIRGSGTEWDNTPYLGSQLEPRVSYKSQARPHLSNDGDEVDLLGLVVERLCEPDDALVRKRDLERGLVLDEVLDLPVHVRVRVSSCQAPEHDRADWGGLK